MDDTSFSSAFELDQSHIHNYEAGKNGGSNVDYSHASNNEQNQHDKSQPHVDYPHAPKSTSEQTHQEYQSKPQRHEDQQQPSQQPEAPQPPPAQPVQYRPPQGKSNFGSVTEGHYPVYQAQLAGHNQFPSQNPMANFVFQKGPNPMQFAPPCPESQHVAGHNVQHYMTPPVQLAQAHYHQASPIYQKEFHQPAAAYPQGTQTRSIHPPGPGQNVAGASPHPAAYQSVDPPACFPPENDHGSAGFGPMPGSENGTGVRVNGAAPGIPVQSPGQVPVIVMQQQVGTEAWKTGLFDCMEDPTNAIITALCPCITFGQIAEIVDNGNTPCATSGLLYGLITFFIAMPCIMSCTYRTKLRSKFGLLETPAPDWVVHFLCEYCAICQEYRELQRRGLDPSIGWQGNVARIQAALNQQQQATMMPPPNQRMMV